MITSSTGSEVAADDLRAALRLLVTPVSVVTTLAGDRAWGMTVSAFTSVCLDPPTMAVCINRATATAEHITDTGRLGLNVLHADQIELSQRFAARGVEKFLDPHDVVTVPDARPGDSPATPLLAGAVLALDCDAIELDAEGTHLLIAARVRALRTDGDGSPLLYGDGTYLRSCPIVPLPAI